MLWDKYLCSTRIRWYQNFENLSIFSFRLLTNKFSLDLLETRIISIKRNISYRNLWKSLCNWIAKSVNHKMLISFSVTVNLILNPPYSNVSFHQRHQSYPAFAYAWNDEAWKCRWLKPFSINGIFEDHRQWNSWIGIPFSNIIISGLNRYCAWI